GRRRHCALTLLVRKAWNRTLRARATSGSLIHLFGQLSEDVFLTPSFPMMYSFAPAAGGRIVSSKVGVAQSKSGHFRPANLPSITNCASTQIKLFGGDIVTQHDREFDREPTGGGCFGYPPWLFL